MELRTERLRLRPPRLADALALFTFLGDPAAMRLTQVDASLRACRRRIAAHERRRRSLGYAPWTIETLDGRIVGWGGLYDDPFDPGWGPELAYFFHPQAWGQGYASELATATLAVADQVLRLPALAAFAHAENHASRRVLEKAGFTLVRPVPQMDRLLFRRTRP